MYDQITVIVDGALEEEENFFDETLEHEFCMKIRDEALGHGYPVEIYRITHDHDANLECECVQYSQDHRPIYAFNISE